VSEPGTFLTAEWRHLVMLNYEIDPTLLLPRVPAGTELDSFGGRTFVSIVGFRFLDTRVLGMPVPFHRNFEEVNLRFYVRRRAADGIRRGVVFVKEIVPRLAIAAVARLVYHENYVAMPMRHSIADASVSYAWRLAGRWESVRLRPAGEWFAPAPASTEEFITEHYWGYAAKPDGSSVEYRVEHPRWVVKRGDDAVLDCRTSTLYGADFAEPLARPPVSAFLADGSDVVVRRGSRLDAVATPGIEFPNRAGSSDRSAALDERPSP
jgi:hypothetical protein